MMLWAHLDREKNMDGLESWGAVVHSLGVRSSAMVVTQSLPGGCWGRYCPLGKALGQIL